MASESIHMKHLLVQLGYCIVVSELPILFQLIFEISAHHIDPLCVAGFFDIRRENIQFLQAKYFEIYTKKKQCKLFWCTFHIGGRAIALCVVYTECQQVCVVRGVGVMFAL